MFQFSLMVVSWNQKQKCSFMFQTYINNANASGIAQKITHTVELQWLEHKVGKKAGNTHISQDGGKYW